MARSISSTEKRGRGRPPVNATSIHLTLPPADLRVLDAFIAAQPDPKPSRPEAIRRMLADCLGGMGYIDAEAPDATRSSF